MNCALEVRAVVQIVRLKTCKQPEYNLHNLLYLLCKYHGYSFDHEDSEKLLEELCKSYIDQTSNTIMYLTVGLCLNMDKKCVCRQVNKLKVQLVVAKSNEEMCAIIDLVAAVTAQYSTDDKVISVGDNVEWLRQLSADFNPGSVKQSAIEALKRLGEE